ncbi:MAG: lipoate--protein ligase, partial [Anaerolineaceae bacterium]|nr:lipoate--protein ligase [Anaerolineaceae bacterium]
EQLLIGVRYNREDIFRILQHVEIGRYFSGLDWQTFGAFLF